MDSFARQRLVHCALQHLIDVKLETLFQLTELFELQHIFISLVLKESANISSCLNSRVADKTGWGLDLLIRLRPRTSSALIYKTSAPSFRKYQNTKRLKFLSFSRNNLASNLKTHQDTRSSLQSLNQIAWLPTVFQP